MAIQFGVDARARRGGLLAAVVVLLLVPSADARAATAIPEGSALWFACTEPVFAGPPSLRCPQPYDPRYLQTFLQGFDRFTPENEFKMVYLEPQQYHFNFTVADQIAAFARAHGKTIRGHTLAWSQQLPFWITHRLLAWNRRSLADAMHSYITTVVSHFATRFPGVVTEWDVVNEPLNSFGGLAWSPWEAAIGPDYIDAALVYAHAADPSARLMINESGAEAPGLKQAALLALATSLKRSGAPLDGVGFEAHVTPATAPSLDQLLWLWRQYAAAGLSVEVTELDVSDDVGVDDPAAKLGVFRRYAEACRLAGNCTGLTVWGVANRYSWLGATGDALLYDANFIPSPAVAAIRDLLGAGAPPQATQPARPRTTRTRRRSHTSRTTSTSRTSHTSRTSRTSRRRRVRITRRR